MICLVIETEAEIQDIETSSDRILEPTPRTDSGDCRLGEGLVIAGLLSLGELHLNCGLILQFSMTFPIHVISLTEPNRWCRE